MNNIFCIVSAIGNQYGVFTYKQRLQQLIESIESIHKYAPGSDVVVYDASEDPLPEEDVIELKKHANDVVLLYNNKYIQFLKYHSKDPSPNKLEKKTVGEIEATKAFLDFLKTFPKKYNRVYKLTGRFKLNQKFSLEEHSKRKNYCVFREREDWFGRNVFVIRLWSFDYEDLHKISDLFNTLQRNTYNKVIQTEVMDVVEFGLTHHIESMNIPYTTIKAMGVEGLHGQDANPVNE